MARVFVSHAGEDTPVACEVCCWLVDDGHEVFLDRDVHDGIAAGDDWEPRLHERLRWADAVVCLMTGAYLRSVWCGGEVAVARSRGSLVLPVLLEPGAAHPLLDGVQRIDARRVTGDARAPLRAALNRLDVAGGLGWPDGLSPYPGLRPFTAGQRRAFFGRKDEVTQLTALLRSPAAQAEEAILLVVGPSGCGKSSLVRAGLQPAVADDPGWWTLTAMTPGAAPRSALASELVPAARLAGLSWSRGDVRQRIEDGGLADLVDDLLLAVPGRGRRRLLLVVDQFEELLTQSSATERARFADLLRPVLGRSTQVVATMRAEFLDRLIAAPELATLPTRVHTLQPLGPDALRSVIEEPARLAGLSIADELVARMAADTGTGAALPLLAYTLAQLADGLTRGDALSAARYRELGGVHGTLSRQADAALADAVTAGGRRPSDVIATLLRVVTVDEFHRPIRGRVDRADLPGQAAAELDAFVARRLLVADRDGARATITVAHEAFLSTWSPLAEAITTHAAALRARASVVPVAAEWTQSGRPQANLWEGGQLAAAVSSMGVRLSRRAPPPEDAPRPWWRPWSLWPGLVVPEQVGVTAAVQEFLRASVRRDTIRRGRASAILAVLLIVAVVGVGVAVDGRRAAEEQRRVATARQLLAQADGLRDADPMTALRLNLAAGTVHPDPDTRAALVDALLPGRFAGRVPGHPGTLQPVALAGDVLVSAGDDDTVVLWEVSDPGRPRQQGPPVPCHQGGVTALAVDRDATLLATAGVDGTVAVWTLGAAATAPQQRAVVRTGHTGALRSLAVTPDGRTLAVGSADHRATVWDLEHLDAPPQTLSNHVSAVDAVAFSPTGTILVTAGNDGNALLWDLADRRRPPQRIGPPMRLPAAVTSAAFSPDGRTLALALGDGTAQLRSVADPADPHPVGQPLPGRSDRATSVAYSPDGSILAVGSADATTTLWDVATPASAHRSGPPLAGHSGAVLAVAFARSRSTLVSAGADRSIVLWDLDDPTRPRRLDPAAPHPGGVSAVTFVGPTLAATRTDGTVSTWDTSVSPPPVRDTVVGPTAITALAGAPSGQLLAAAGDDGHASLWNVSAATGPRLVGALPGTPAAALWGLAFSPDGRLLAAAGADHRARIWDVSAPGAPGVTPEQGEWLRAVAFAPDRPVLATASLDGEIALWDVGDPAAPRLLGPPTRGHRGAVDALAFAPHGQLLASAGDDGTVVLWHVGSTPDRIGALLDGNVGAVDALAFSPDGGLLVTAGQDRTALLWDLTDVGAPRRIGSALAGHADAVRSVAIAPDGGFLATGGLDGTVVTWSLDRVDRVRADPTGFACRITGRGLDPTEWTTYVGGLDRTDPCRP